MSIRLQTIPQPPDGHRDWYLFEAVRAVPRLLLMLDKNPASPTYGSFDREYWHYRTMDFPCGMNQEFCLALAMAVTTSHPHNPFAGNERLRELVQASLSFSARVAHSDGTCDDYFPHEKALGALVFSLYAMTESYQVLQIQDDRLVEFFVRRGKWLLDHNESGQLANHQALAALALQNVFVLTGSREFQAGVEHFRDLTLSWQHDEGWFQEYEGADPGYHSCSIDFLAKLRQKTNDSKLTTPLLNACAFAANFMHPDGSYAGEYGSRNTYHFYPHGFELLARESNDALQIAELYLRKALPRRTRYFNDDNRMAAHYVYDWFQAWRDYSATPERSTMPCFAEPRTVFFEGAGILVKRNVNLSVIVAANKGGVIKIVNGDGPVYSDTGPLVQLINGTTLVSHLVAPDNEISWDAPNETLTINGNLCRRRAPIMTPWKQIAFRLLSMTLGRINPNWLRIFVQKLFITGKPTTRSTFRRTFRFLDGEIQITDEVRLAPGAPSPTAVFAAPDATSIYVANSNTYQATNLLPVRNLDTLFADLRQRGEGREVTTIRIP